MFQELELNGLKFQKQWMALELNIWLKIDLIL
jgi:hypothetical protein